MRRTVFALAAAAAFLAASAVAVQRADRASEPSRPKDYSRDFQVPAAPDAPMAVVISADFEAGTPPAGWTVVDNEGTGTVWTNLAGCGEGNYVNASADVACVSSDNDPGEFDTELRTPVFSMADYGAPAALTFTANYQNFAALDFFQVDGSTDGGSTWTNLLSWNEDHGPFAAPPGVAVNLDVTSFAGQANVMFRFHYFDPNSNDWDWYIQIDDVVVDATPAAPPLILQEIPTASKLGLAALAVLLAGAAALVLRRR